MIEEGATTIEELLLHDEDFPEEYVHMAHPGDYKAVQEFKPQFIMHSHFGRHNRLIARVAWKTGNGTVLPMSFHLQHWSTIPHLPLRGCTAHTGWRRPAL